MEQELRSYVIEGPEAVLGEMLGKLNTLGAWLVGGTEGAKNGNVRVEVKIPANQVGIFKS